MRFHETRAQFALFHMATSPTILVDTIPIVPDKVGVRVYLDALLKAIPRERRASIRLVCTRSNIDLYRDFDDYAVTVLPWNTSSRPLRVLTQQVALPLLVARFRPDVLFEPIDHAAIMAPAPIVTSIHSSHINLHHGHMEGMRKWYNRIFTTLTAWRSRRFIAISEYVKQAAIELLDVDPERIDVVHHGGGLVERARKNGWSPPDIHERDGSILFVSSLHPHKNADQLIRGYAALRSRVSDVPSLVIVGKDVNGARSRLERLAEDSGVAPWVTFEGRVSDERLLELLASARLMVYPSSLEGFGLPAVEAMQAGVPLIASDKTSVPEIVGDGGRIVSPEDTGALVAAMEEGLTRTSVRQSLVQAGYHRGEHFSWIRTAEATLRILDDAVRLS
jgi:glycosyltransferase involved in cell wall biosynthesis